MASVTPSAKSYTASSVCAAKLNIRRTTATSLNCIVEAACSVKANTKPRKSMTLQKAPLQAADFNVWWQKVRVVACECDAQSAWGNASDA